MSIITPLPYPQIDSLLGEELHAGEEDLANKIAEEIEKGIRAQYQSGTARRDVHAKATGTVKAEFRVNENLPPHLAQGVFIPGHSYEAWVRFSNASGNLKQSDKHFDGRGMAIKLLNVPGKKLLESEETALTQDFIMINHPVFFLNDPERYLKLIEKANSKSLLAKLTIPLTLGLDSSLAAARVGLSKITNPLQVRYFSTVPYQLGVGAERQVVKFSAQPVSALVDPIPAEAGADFLREALRKTLAQGDFSMKFLLQLRNSPRLSVEDSMVEWDEADAPFYEVATIHFPQQDFDTAEFNQIGENLSFNPWHALPEHRPLGVLNRLRKVIYEHISQVRHAMNQVHKQEP